MKSRNAAALGVIVSSVAIMAVAGCGNGQQICDRLAPPTPIEIQASNGGAEVERTVDGTGLQGDTECELENGRWTYDAPDRKKH